ncbi:ferredoxin [candidate division FCPU426 bacterium]|nr:ferredoxin [candidate division FCPU426 bacterium]
MNGQSIAEAYVDPVPPGLEDLAREAAGQCPVEAILVK